MTTMLKMMPNLCESDRQYQPWQDSCGMGAASPLGGSRPRGANISSGLEYGVGQSAINAPNDATGHGGILALWVLLEGSVTGRRVSPEWGRHRKGRWVRGEYG